MLSKVFDVSQHLQEKSALNPSTAERGFKEALRKYLLAEKFSRIWELDHNRFKLSLNADPRLYGYNSNVQNKDGYLVCNESGAGDTIRLYLNHNGRVTSFQRDHVFELRFLGIIFMRHAMNKTTQAISFHPDALTWLCEVASDWANSVWIPEDFHTAKTQYFSGNHPLTEEVRLYLVECAAALNTMVINKHANFHHDQQLASGMVTEMATDILGSAFSRIYGNSEEWLGKTGAGKRFAIDSKAPGGFVPGSTTGETIPQLAKEAVELLGTNVDVYYIHAPDPSVELENQLKGINEAYKSGYFKRFGLSNFKAADVQRAYDICQAKGYPLPTVYQANYSAVARKQETELVPTLRKLGISFYVYSPMAGGLLTKTSEQIRAANADAGRYAKDDALRVFMEAAKVAGCSRGELAYRWVAFDSAIDPKYGEVIVFGASKLSQISETLAWLKRGSVGEAAKAKLTKSGS
ncbi:NADP-dependent oxidoreductase domain-containing protein [Mycena sanguinolenta]|nr:NADP-dependent oxidoreductase domain-containing protein [Mycena sanguinolenta]